MAFNRVGRDAVEVLWDGMHRTWLATSERTVPATGSPFVVVRQLKSILSLVLLALCSYHGDGLGLFGSK